MLISIKYNTILNNENVVIKNLIEQSIYITEKNILIKELNFKIFFNFIFLINIILFSLCSNLIIIHIYNIKKYNIILFNIIYVVNNKCYFI